MASLKASIGISQELTGYQKLVIALAVSTFSLAKFSFPRVLSDLVGNESALKAELQGETIGIEQQNSNGERTQIAILQTMTNSTIVQHHSVYELPKDHSMEWLVGASPVLEQDDNDTLTLFKYDVKSAFKLIKVKDPNFFGFASTMSRPA